MADLTIWPEIPEPLINYLKEVFPPRCKSRSESIETHMLYAGKVEMVETMFNEFVLQQAARYSPEVEDVDDDLVSSVEVT